MKKTFISLLIATALSGIYSTAYAETDIEIDEIDVSGEISDNKADKAFNTARAVVVRGSDKRLQSLNSVVRSLPGVYTNMDATQGTLTINVRGMTGLGRVSTLVDGVPQTFFGTSANGNRKYHDNDEGGLGPSSQFGTMIEPNFLASLTVHKGFSSGAAGTNSLAGSAELRTIGVDDVIFAGNKVGVISKFQYGTNALGYSGMLGVAGKTKAFTDTGSVGALVAYSQRHIGSNFKRGDGTYASINKYNKRMDQRPKSWLAKVEVNPTSDQHILLSGVDYLSNIGGRDIINKSYSIKYNYTPNSDLIDLEVLASKTKSDQQFDNDAVLWELEDGSTKNNSYYFNLQNRSYFNFNNSKLTLEYGANYFTNDYARSAKGKNQDNLEHTPFSPTGKQKIFSSFLSSKWEKDIYTVEGGLLYTRSIFSGFKPECTGPTKEAISCVPMGAWNVKMVNYSLNPSVQLSVELSPWFKPFMSYAKTTRMPNIQEIFFNNEGGGSMNPFLKPEKATTAQVGFNTFKHGVFTEDDKLGAKLVYYRTKYENYIFSKSFHLSKKNELTEDPNDIGPAGFQAQISVNSLDPIKHSGIELELNYDNHYFFSHLTYSHQKTSQPLGVQASTDGFGYGDIYELPEYYGSLDTGFKLFNQKLILGSILKYMGTAYRLNPYVETNEDGKYSIEKEKLPVSPIIVDFYATYKVNKNLMLKASVQNAFNKLYIDPLNSQNTIRGEENVTNYARGRTFILGGELRF